MQEGCSIFVLFFSFLSFILFFFVFVSFFFVVFYSFIQASQSKATSPQPLPIPIFRFVNPCAHNDLKKIVKKNREGGEGGGKGDEIYIL